MAVPGYNDRDKDGLNHDLDAEDDTGERCACASNDDYPRVTSNDNSYKAAKFPAS